MSPVPSIRDISWIKTSSSPFSLDEWQRKDGKSDGERRKPAGEENSNGAVLLISVSESCDCLLYTNTNEAEKHPIFCIQKNTFSKRQSEETIDWGILPSCSVPVVTGEKSVCSLSWRVDVQNKKNKKLNCEKMVMMLFMSSKIMQRCSSMNSQLPSVVTHHIILHTTRGELQGSNSIWVWRLRE